MEIKDYVVSGCRVIDTNQESGYESYNEAQEEALKGFDVCVTDYSYGSYEGNGIAFMRDENRKWYFQSLCHCSCYGPWEGASKVGPFDSYHDAMSSITDGYESKLAKEMLDTIKQFE